MRASCWASIWAVTQERRLTRPAVLFNHVPSTGGSTWEVLWSRYACASNLTACPYSEAVGRTISADRPASGTPYCKPSDDVVASHMTPAGFRALRAARAAYLPQKKYLTVTMVREPCGATLARFLHPQHAHHSIVPRLCEVDAFKSTYERPHAREDVDKKIHRSSLLLLGPQTRQPRSRWRCTSGLAKSRAGVTLPSTSTSKQYTSLAFGSSQRLLQMRHCVLTTLSVSPSSLTHLF